MANGNTDVIDLHYTTTAEAIAIVEEVLNEGWVSPSECDCCPVWTVTEVGQVARSRSLLDEGHIHMEE